MDSEHYGTGDPREGLVVPKALKEWLVRHAVAPQHLVTYSDPTDGRTVDPMRDSPATRGIVRQLVGMLWSAPERAPQPDAEPVKGEVLVTPAMISEGMSMYAPGVRLVDWEAFAAWLSDRLRARVQPRGVSREAIERELRADVPIPVGVDDVTDWLCRFLHRLDLGLQIEGDTDDAS